jgi:hypothetical protein
MKHIPTAAFFTAKKADFIKTEKNQKITTH